MSHYVRKALKQTCEAVPCEVSHVPLDHWNESVFRWLFIRNIRAITPGIECWSEWNRIDLVLAGQSAPTLIEFKWFAHRPLPSFRSSPVRMKGGPSAKNFREFENSIQTLTASASRQWSRDFVRIEAAYFILAYCDPMTANAHSTYGSFYDKLRAGGAITAAETIVERMPVDANMALTCKLLTISVENA